MPPAAFSISKRFEHSTAFLNPAKHYQQVNSVSISTANSISTAKLTGDHFLVAVEGYAYIMYLNWGRCLIYYVNTIL